MVTSMVTKDGVWDDKEVAALKRYRLAGFSMAETAKFLGRSPNAVHRKLLSIATHDNVADMMPIRDSDVAAATKRNATACTLHLIDLMRSFRGKTLGQAKAAYVKRHEYEINNGGIITHNGDTDHDYDFS